MKESNWNMLLLKDDNQKLDIREPQQTKYSNRIFCI